MVLPSNVPDAPAGAAPPPPPRRRLRPGLGTLLVSLLALVALVGVFAYFGLSHSPLGLPSPAAPAATRATTAPANTTASGPTATPTDATAIQQVIQRGDEAQAQALSSKDPTPMRDLATPDYYDLMVATNQDLVDGGVVAIKLIRIEWGTITVSGTSATATCYETWSTTFADGSVDQTRDLNVYSLVQQNGTWIVQADDHPNATSLSSPASAGP